MATFTAHRSGGDMTQPVMANVTLDAATMVLPNPSYKVMSINPLTFAANSSEATFTVKLLKSLCATNLTGQIVYDIGNSGSGCCGCGGNPYVPISPSTATLTLEGTANTQCAGCPTLGSGALPLTGDFTTPAAALASDVDIVTGTYFQDHQLVTYSSQGQDRGIDLQYSSLQANPLPIVQMTLVATSGPAAITEIETQLVIDGVSQSSAEVAHPASGLTGGQSFTIAAQAGTPALPLATGIYPYTLTYREKFADNSYSAYDSISSSLDIVNRSLAGSPASAYGAGWSIGDLQSIIVTNPATNPLPANSVLVTAGSTGSMDFTTFDGTNYSGTASDTSTLIHYPAAPNGYYWARTYPDGTIIRFDASGRETSISDRNNNTTSYAYVATGPGAGALATITDPVGLVTTLSYDSSNKLSTVTDPAGRVTTFSLGSTYENLYQIVDPDLATTTFGYGTTSNHLITTEISPNGQTATVTYDMLYNRVSSEALFGGLGTTSVSLAQEQGLAAVVVIPVGSSIATVGSITDPNHKTTTMSFDSMYEPITEVDATTGTGSYTYVRNDRNWVTSATDPDSRTTTYSYDSLGNITGETRYDGSYMTITYRINSQPITVTDYRGLTTTYMLDGKGNVLQEIDPDGFSQDWTYNASGQVLSSIDRNGNDTYFYYDNSGRLISESEPAIPSMDVARGGTATGSAAPSNSPASAFDQSLTSKWVSPATGSYLQYQFAAGAAYVVTRYAITSGNDTATYTGRAPTNWNFQGSNDGSSWTTLDTEVNQADLLNADTRYFNVATPGSYAFYRLNITGNNGATDYTQLDELQLLATRPRMTFGYSSAGNVISTVDDVGNKNSSTYDNANRLLSSQNPIQAAASKATSYTYDADGNLKTVTDALVHVTSYAYDARDRLMSMTESFNQMSINQTIYVYNGMNLTSVTDPNSNTTTFSYDGQNRLTGTTDAMSDTTTWVYDNAGLLTSLIDANAHTTTYTYDTVGRLQTVTVPTATSTATTTYAYNDDDQVTAITDPLSHTITYGYDNLLRLTSITDSPTAGTTRTTTFGYDLAGNQTTVTDPLGHTTTSAYDARDRLISQQDPAGGGTTRYTYDAASRLTSVTDPVGNLTSYRYDGANRVVSQVDPKAATTAYTYDLVDNLKTVVDRDGRTTSYGYDADNRRNAEQWITGGSTTYSMTVTYDPGGRVTGIADNNSQYSYGYDYANRMNTMAEQDPGLPAVNLSYVYDNVGNRTSMADSKNGVVSYTYDPRNELTTITQSGSGTVAYDRVDMLYDPAGRMTTMTRYSDTTGTNVVARTVNAYDNANRLTATTNTNPAGSTISSYAYTLDAADRLTQLARTWNAGAASDTATYGYTNNDQLTSVTHTNSSLPAETFGFDANGNRNTTGYSTAASNQTTADGAFNYTYDAEGNLLTKTPVGGGTQTVYTWDNRNRLTQVQQVTGGTPTTVAQFTYDALDRLIKVVEGTVTRTTLYDGQTPLLDFNAGGAVTARYLSVPGAVDEVLARQTASGTAWYLADRLGSVNDLIDNSANLLDHIDYGSFGNVVAESSPSTGDRFKYAGMEADAATGLYYDRARWYDPKAGKFVGQDPTGFGSGDDNFYRYSTNGPTNNIDPTGLGILGCVDKIWAGYGDWVRAAIP
jgi:RHS repeat-associated protein